MAIVKLLRLLAAAAVLAGANPATAGIISFTDWVDTDAPTADYTLTIDDNTAGRFTFNASVDSGFEGSMLALGFGTNGFDYNSGNLGLIPNTYTTSFDSLVCNPGNGCNWNGSGLSSFEVIVRFADQGSGVGTISFSIAQLAGMQLADFNLVGIRAQDTGPQGGDLESDKVYSNTPSTPPTEVPEPATLMLLGVGLVGLGFARRTRRI